MKFEQIKLLTRKKKQAFNSNIKSPEKLTKHTQCSNINDWLFILENPFQIINKHTHKHIT